MRKLTFIPPLTALAMGAVGAVLRKKELASVFDPVSGLAERGAAVTVSLAVLSVVAVAAAFLFAFVFVKKTPGFSMQNYPGDNSAAFGRSGVSVVLSAAAGAVMVGAAFMMYRELYPVGHPLVRKIFFAVAALTGICTAVNAAGGRNSAAVSYANLVPELFFCFWLAITYKLNGRSPVVIGYCYECFAYASAVLAYYSQAGFGFKRGNPFWTAAFSFMAVYFLTVYPADGKPTPASVFMAAALLDILVRFCCLLSGNKEVPAEAGEEGEE